MTATQEQQDVVDLLQEQHSQIKNYFAELRIAQGERKRKLFEQLVRLLAVHETAEEEIVHPAARVEIPSGEQVVASRLEEESEAKKVLAELYEMGVDHPQFDAKLATFATSVIEHATREEQDEFRYLRQSLPADRLRRMAGAVQVAEATAPTRPHPEAGESATANIIAGPPLAMFDRIRDAVRDWRQSSGGS